MWDVQPLGETGWQFYIKLIIWLPHNLAIALLGKIPHKRILQFMFKICIQMCIAALFVISHDIVWIFMPCKYSYFEILISMVIVLGSRIIRVWLDHKGIIFINRIFTIMKKTRGRPFMFSTIWRHSKKMAIHEPESQPSPDTKPVDALRTSQLLELWNISQLFLSHPVNSI